MAKRTTMNISLTPALERFVHKQVKSGQYQSSSEVVREGLRALEQEKKRRAAALKELQQKIDVGIRAIERGEVVDGETAFREIEARLIRRMAASKRRAS